MDFGLWVEPEMVNPDSDFYRAHPDWVMNFPGRPRSELRNQLILNLARDDVKEYIFGFLDKLASTYNIRYFKWDMNRTFAEPGWPEVCARSAAGVMGEVRLEPIRASSNGCGRSIRIWRSNPAPAEVAVLTWAFMKYVDEFWTSDNTEAFDRLRIQEGFSQAYTAKYMSAWVTDVPNMNGRSTPLEVPLPGGDAGRAGRGGEPE